LSFKSSSFLILLLRLLWVCEQRVCVVQAKRHIHSIRRLDPVRAGTPCRISDRVSAGERLKPEKLPIMVALRRHIGCQKHRINSIQVFANKFSE
jgi:hypothetical protein